MVSRSLKIAGFGVLLIIATHIIIYFYTDKSLLHKNLIATALVVNMSGLGVLNFGVFKKTKLRLGFGFLSFFMAYLIQFVDFIRMTGFIWDITVLFLLEFVMVSVFLLKLDNLD